MTWQEQLEQTKAICEKYRAAINKVLGTDWELWQHKMPMKEWNKFEDGRYELKNAAGKVLASFELQMMINCCGICVSTRAEVHSEYRGKGLGTILNAMRIDMARDRGYGLLLCTDVEKNIYQRKILSRNGWRDVHKFVNPRTKNTIFVSVVNL